MAGSTIRDFRRRLFGRGILIDERGLTPTSKTLVSKLYLAAIPHPYDLSGGWSPGWYSPTARPVVIPLFNGFLGQESIYAST